MKKQNWVLLLAVWVLAAGSVYAQFSLANHIEANVPFDFMVGDTLFPAGQYTVGPIAEQTTLVIKSVKDTRSKFMISQAAVANKPQETSKLVFHKYGDRYILSQIWVQGESRGRELPRTRLEKELASAAQRDSVTIVASK